MSGAQAPAGIVPPQLESSAGRGNCQVNYQQISRPKRRGLKDVAPAGAYHSEQ